ncbi:Elongation factor 1-gamma 1 [Venturia nashicola]|uniref:Elongation factor 1-gamma 1 n=1 Tax=Venturia nashicola TaxID=86259 RepID=A0A4Z1P9Z5_9PEZI|nr:Elongation factor 1-gamma 1 [Venturia nashicola]
MSDSPPSYQPPADIKTRLKASYDAMAPEYNEWTTGHFAIRLEYLDKLISKLLEKKGRKSVLELGCGCGIPVSEKLLSYPDVCVTANDLSATQIALARQNLKEAGDRVQFLEGDMTALDFATGSFDAAVAFYSIIHLPRDEQVTLLGDIFKWLKPGGYLLANFSAQESQGVEMEKWLAEEGWMFWAGWGREGTVGKIRDAGLEILIEEVKEDVVDATDFLWVIARKD